MLILNNYWLAIPISLSLQIALALYIRRQKKKREAREAELNTTNLKIFYLASLNARGGEELIRVIQPLNDMCIEVIDTGLVIRKDVQYLNNEYLRKVSLLKFPYKVKNNLLLITRMAMGYFARQFGHSLLSNQILSISDWIILSKKVLYVVSNNIGVSVLTAYGATSTSLIVSL